MMGRVLIVAGSDSSGGAGIQADIKTVTALGGYAMTAITALTAQNTEGVTAIHEVPADFVAEQMRVTLTDIGADCIKLGMLHRPEVIEAVADVLIGYAAATPVVVDPVMIAKGGASLLEAAAVAALKARILPLATLTTPNIPEAEVLSGIEIRSPADIESAAGVIAEMSGGAVLLKGGHAAGDTVSDLLRTADGVIGAFSGPRIESRHTHGTGCTLAAAIATGIAQGLSMVDAVGRARAYVVRAIETAPGLGKGHGPLNHGHTVVDFKS